MALEQEAVQAALIRSTSSISQGNDNDAVDPREEAKERQENTSRPAMTSSNSSPTATASSSSNTQSPDSTNSQQQNKENGQEPPALLQKLFGAFIRDGGGGDPVQGMEGRKNNHFWKVPAIDDIVPTSDTGPTHAVVQAIMSSQDIPGLVVGLDNDLRKMISSAIDSTSTRVDNNVSESADSGTTATGVNVAPVKESPDSKELPASATEEDAMNSESLLPTHTQTLAARLSRIKFLLYNERNSAPSSNIRSKFPTVASAVLHYLVQINQDDLVTTNGHNNNDRDQACDPSIPTQERTQPLGQALIPALLKNLHILPFEARKDVASVFNYLLVCGCDNAGGGLLNGSEEMSSSSFHPHHYFTNFSDNGVKDAKSFVDTMVTFVSFIEKNYVEVMSPIIAGHQCGDGCGTGTPGTDTNSKIKPTSIAITPDVALHCGSMFRTTLRHPSLYALLLSEPHAQNFVYPFLDTFVHQPNFEVASDALETLRLILTGTTDPILLSDNVHDIHQQPSNPNPELIMENIASQFLQNFYEPLLDQRFTPLLLSPKRANYLTRRVSLQLLSQILLTRSNYNAMIRFISSRTNLISIMLLLSDASPHITLDAFHVFKVFVVNPNKPNEILKILMDNKVKLVKYLEGLHKEREDTDEQFRDEKGLVINTLLALDAVPADGVVGGDC